MPLVTSKQMMLDAQSGHYAIGAFNVENMEMIQAVTAAAEELKSPIILQTSPTSFNYADMAYFYVQVKVAANQSTVPIALHLDHCKSFELVIQAVKTGFTSIMIDGSHSNFKENISLTKSVVDVCHPVDIPVEAELGKVGGKKNDIESDDPGYTDPLDALEFVKKTDVDSLAVAIGTVHGIYKGEPILDLERLSAINETVSVPLVLHGSSDVPSKTIQECIKRGVCKVNYATDLRQAYTKSIFEVLHAHPKIIDPRIYGATGKKHIQRCVMDIIKILGSDGKA